MIDLRNKNVLIVGSGCDLIGRRMSKWINDFDGVVIRVNKRYGDPLDVGTRCDLWVTRWLSWIGNITPSEAVDYVVLNDYQGITAGETEIIRQEVGHSHVSAGLMAVCWAQHRGAKRIFVLGFGYSPASRGFFPKTYTAHYAEKKAIGVSSNKRDYNPHYDWKKEAAFLINNKITLL